jgi:ABC-type branched-subunit amino acid transport system substrate-binding protein
MTRTLKYICLFLLLASIFLANRSHAIEQEHLIIGAISGQTGAASKYARFSRMGMELALSELNGSEVGRQVKIELIYENSETLPQKSLTAFNSLVEARHAKIVIGELWGHLTEPLIPVAERKKLLLLSPAVMPHALKLRSPYYFTLGHKVELVAPIYKQFFKINPQIKRVAIITWDNDWGLGYSNVFTRVTQELGLEIIAEEKSNDWNNDFKTEVTRILSKKPDMIFVPYLAERVNKRLLEFNKPISVLTTLNILEPLMDPNYPVDTLENIYFTDFPASEDYNEKFRALHKEPSQFESHLSYEALHAAVKAYLNNSEQPTLGLRQVKYTGVGGVIDFTQSNFGNNASPQLMQIKAGKGIPVPDAN